MNWPEPLVENVNYLVVNVVSETCDEIWLVDTDAEYRQFICKRCFGVTAESAQAISSHQRFHMQEDRHNLDIIAAWQYLPETIQKKLLARVKMRHESREYVQR